MHTQPAQAPGMFVGRAHKTCPPYGVLFLLWLILGMGTVAAESIPVQSKSFAELAIYPQHSAPATVVSDNHSRISAELTARILDIPVRVGEQVKKGALLARLDKQDFELALIRAQSALDTLNAKLELAKYELKRARSLSKKQVVSEQLLKQRETERDALLAQLRGQQAAVTQARTRLEKTKIRAPFAAVIVERLGQVGELASPGMVLLRIIDTNNLELSAKLSVTQTDELLAALAAKNNAAEFISAGQRYAVTLRVITPVLDTRARTREARLLFTRTSSGNIPDNKPLPGSAGKLLWLPAQASLPASFISQRDGKLGVFVLTGNTARFVALPQAKTGRPAMVELASDTLIITDGRYRLHDGDTVSPH